MMRQAKHIELLEFEAAPQHFVAAVPRQHTQIDTFPFFDAINHVALVLAERIVFQFHRVEDAKAGKAIARLLDFRAIELLAFIPTETAPFRSFGERWITSTLLLSYPRRSSVSFKLEMLCLSFSGV